MTTSTWLGFAWSSASGASAWDPRQREAVARQRADLDRLDAELTDLEDTIAAAGRAARGEMTMPDSPIRVLFVCTGNSARSQLAEALLGQMGGADFFVASAGTEPKGVNPYAVRVLSERGIDWSGARTTSSPSATAPASHARSSPASTTPSTGVSRTPPRSRGPTRRSSRHSSERRGI